MTENNTNSTNNNNSDNINRINETNQGGTTNNNNFSNINNNKNNSNTNHHERHSILKLHIPEPLQQKPVEEPDHHVKPKRKKRDKSDLGDNFVAPDGGWGWLVAIAGGINIVSMIISRIAFPNLSKISACQKKKSKLFRKLWGLAP